MSQSTKPFHPGGGAPPTHIGGRKNEKRDIDLTLRFIAAETDEHGRVPEIEPAVVLLGPRGVGKTALLGYANERAREMGINVMELVGDKLKLTLAKGPGPDPTQEKLMGFLGKLNIGSASELAEKAVKLATGNDVSFSKVDISKLGFLEALEGGLELGPFLLLVDEAHALPGEVLNSIALDTHNNIYQRIPVSLMMAGTPGLSRRLRESDATFMERSTTFRMNLLTGDEAREALSRSLEIAGMGTEPGALELMLEWADRYPYFLQLAGDCAWKEATARDSGTVTIADTDRGLASADLIRSDFYDGRFQELRALRIHGEAAQVVDMFRRHGEKFDGLKLVRELTENNEGIDEDRALEIERQLLDLGFLHSSAGYFEPGIPSLFDYVKSRVEADGRN